MSLHCFRNNSVGCVCGKCAFVFCVNADQKVLKVLKGFARRRGTSLSLTGASGSSLLEYATGVERYVSAGQEVGKFGRAEDEQKEENSASSLGSERFLLAFSQTEVPSAKLQKLAHAVVTPLHARNSAMKN